MIARPPDLFDARVERANRPTIAELRAKYGPTWGIKTMAAAARHERELRHAKECADRAILAEYAALGLDPVHTNDGTLVSPALLRALNRMPETHHG